ncbi:hypothetical protein F511_26580 [Dorcoceras hygrometricum]|uniref:Uncharacterized protein n=1 Tax=Dorcoceras hygrometricum TaxID=472368 RepID=A0A2Z7ANR1_9LAMI|nr:hypothetical protein F511_26580 [Dorcoceras hygrometricum]
MDSGVYGDEFRFLGVLVGAEDEAWCTAGAAELPGDGVRPRQGVGMVVGAGSQSSAAVDGAVYGGDHGVGRLRRAVLCIKNFPSNRPLAVSLMVSFNGLSAALYNLAAKSFSPSSSIYLLLNALLPLVTSIVALVPILRQPSVDTLPPDAIRRDQITFLLLNFIAVTTGLYLLFLHPSNKSTACLLFSGAICLLVLPLGIAGIIYAREWFHNMVYSSFHLQDSGFILVDEEELHKQLLSRESSSVNQLISSPDVDGSMNEISRQNSGTSGGGCCDSIIKKDQLVMLGEEHNVEVLLRRFDFWLYFVTYFCGGTIGLVYSNNLGQIAQSLGHSSFNSRLITIYSTFSFFGRLLSAAPDFIRPKLYFARTGWLTIALLPTPIAFVLLAVAGNDMMAVQVGTALIGLSSGFIFAAAVSITSELFGPNGVGVNHNILIANIPIGSLVYGFLAAIVYDMNGISMSGLLGWTVDLNCQGVYRDPFPGYFRESSA